MIPSQVWLQCMKDLWRMERAARLNELRGRRVRSFNDSGIHEQSELWGRVWLAEGLCPYLQGFGSHPTELRAQARVAAEEAFRQEILLAAVVNGDVLAPEEEPAHA